MRLCESRRTLAYLGSYRLDDLPEDDIGRARAMLAFIEICEYAMRDLPIKRYTRERLRIQLNEKIGTHFLGRKTDETAA